MEKVEFHIKEGEIYKATYNKLYCRVDNSYRANDEDVLELTKKLRDTISIKSYIKYERSVKSWAIEWIAHSRLYRLGLFKKHTKDVDFDADESYFRRFCYCIIALDYVIVLGTLKA